MKICDVVLNSIWYDPRVRKQIDTYSSYGYDTIAVGVSDNRYSDEAVSEIPCTVRIVHVPEAGLLRHLRRILRKVFSVANVISHENPEWIHANDFDALIPAIIAKRRTGAKLIYDSHEIACDQAPTIRFKRIRKTLIVALERYAIKRYIDVFCCVSNSAADYFAEKYKCKRPTVITNSCSSEVVTSDTLLSSNKSVLLHGRFYKGRGYEEAVRAFMYLRNESAIGLQLRGFGELEPDLRRIISENELCNVEILPPVKTTELVDAASTSSVGLALTDPCCLNFLYSISNKIFEYAAAGLAVIMTDIPEHRYLNSTYNFGLLIEKNEPEMIAQAIKAIYSDEGKLHTMRLNAIRMARELCWEKEFEKLRVQIENSH